MSRTASLARIPRPHESVILFAIARTLRELATLLEELAHRKA